jgi:hypothetical protein
MRSALCLAISVLCFGCAYNAPVKPSVLENTAGLSVSPDVAWQRAMRVLAAQGAMVKIADKAQGIITTDKATVRLNEVQADCGNIWGIPYLKDSRTMTEVAYSVYLLGDGNRTSVTVNTKIEGRFKATATQQATTELSCFSLGILERDLITKIQQERP